MYFFDTYALVEIYIANPSYKSYFNLQITTSVLNLGEFYIYLVRAYGNEDGKRRFDLFSFNLVDITKDTMMEATEFKLLHAKKKLSWADCIGYILARQTKLKFLTGDSEFKNLENVEFVQ
ncbi:PIN domain-containing protein [Candidatus Woesearchaeota archaeon]|nr:PIN domain-containing protein [Candidatus Woesearchaeota archaeon]